MAGGLDVIGGILENREMLDCLSDAVMYVDADSKVVYMNKSAESLTEFENKSGDMPKFSDVCRLVNLSTMEGYFDPVNRVLRSNNPVSLKDNIGVIMSDGTSRRLNSQFFPIRDPNGKAVGCSVVMRDINKVTALEKELENEQSAMRSIFDVAKIGMCKVSIKGYILDANKTALEMMGRDYGGVVGKQLGDVFRCVNSLEHGCGNNEECRYCVIRNNLNEAVRKDSYYSDFIAGVNSQISNDIKWLRIFLSQTYFGGEKHILLAIMDVSKHKAREKELEDAKSLAETSSMSKSKFLANVNHEIRTPINGMCGMINLTLRTDLTEEQRENLSSAKECSQDLIRMVDGILDYLKLENGNMHFEKNDMDLHVLLDDVRRMCCLEAERRSVKFVLHKAADIPKFIKGDHMRIRQILENVLVDAIRFSNSEIINMQCRTVSFNEQKMLEFVIYDDSVDIGIFGADAALKPLEWSESYIDRLGGTGMGLMLVKKLAEGMGGSAWVDSAIAYERLALLIRLPLEIASGADRSTGDRSIYINYYRDSINSLNVGKMAHGNAEKLSNGDDINDLLQYCNEKIGLQ